MKKNVMLKSLNDLPPPGKRFDLNEVIGNGVFGTVWKASDTEANNRTVAVKIQSTNETTESYILEECRILELFSTHPNLIEFFGGFRKAPREIWFVQEFCEGGSILSLSKAMLHENRILSEFHIAFILKEVIKAAIHLHDNNIIHRDIRCNNVMLTKDGEVKLIDYGLSCRLDNAQMKKHTVLGSPCWLAPEIVNNSSRGYDNRVDVWAIGISAIELADGKAPLQDMHPTRAIFHIIRNPPPTLYRQSLWSNEFNDFINECLVKNPDHRPYMVEIIEHPFFESVPENNYHVCQEIKSLLEKFCSPTKPSDYTSSEVIVQKNQLLQKATEPEEMYMEDLAAVENPTEDAIFKHLQARIKKGQFQSFIGDVFLALNPYESSGTYRDNIRKKYNCKSRSDNEPHIFAVADGAHQNGLHHGTNQNIILFGESGSGKTTNFQHLFDHLIYLGDNSNINEQRIRRAVDLLQHFTQASTPLNINSTRCVFRLELAFGRTGKISGAVFDISQIEKWRVSSTDMAHGNFNALYYFYDGILDAGSLSDYNLKPDRSYRYLRVGDEKYDDARDAQRDNIDKYREMIATLRDFSFSEEEIDTFHKIVCAILILGEVRFQADTNGRAGIVNEEDALTVAKLLGIDPKKFCWSLTHYCYIENKKAFKKKHTTDEARDARDVLANTLYIRLLDYIVANINQKLSFGITIFGHKFSIFIMDFFGFECFKKNHLQQLLVNTFNEQMHYHYLQRVFAWEAMDLRQEEIKYEPVTYYSNKPILDQILAKEEGVLSFIDHASKTGHDAKYINECIEKLPKGQIQCVDRTQFTIGHYTGRVMYDCKEMADRNRDFLPSELMETLRLSTNRVIKILFINKLSKTGNLQLIFEDCPEKNKVKSKSYKKETHEFSQIKRRRTAISIFKALCIQILKKLSNDAEGTHFVKCVRSNLKSTPHALHAEMVKQQLRAMAITETAKARQNGYPCRISFNEFLRRYQFLAFDFDENVEVTKDNCRLLFIRLQMEGWQLGKNKALLTYYNEEYLSRLYETQVKKVVKIQSMIRAYVARKRMLTNIKRKSIQIMRGSIELTDEDAALILQKAYRGMTVRKQYAPLLNKGALNEETADFIRPYAMKWKNKSMFQVLLQYRAAKYQDLYNFSQQLHLFNQKVFHYMCQNNAGVELKNIDEDATVESYIGVQKPTVLKVPFRLQEIPFYDTCHLRKRTNSNLSDYEETWDKPLSVREYIQNVNLSNNATPKRQCQTRQFDSKIADVKFTREPDEKILLLSPVREERRPVTPTREIPPKSPIVPIRTYQSSNYTMEKTNNFTTKSANKDFEYIKSSPAKKGPTVNPIAELQKLGRRASNVSEDDPPFNFQGMLRKTNFNRESLKRSVETISFITKQNSNNTEPIAKMRSSLKKIPSSNSISDDKRFSGEISPGVYMEGYVSDL